MTWKFIETCDPTVEDDMYDHEEYDYHIQCSEDGMYILWHDEKVRYTSENGYEYKYTLIREFDDLQKAMAHVEWLVNHEDYIENPDSPKYSNNN